MEQIEGKGAKQKIVISGFKKKIFITKQMKATYVLL